MTRRRGARRRRGQAAVEAALGILVSVTVIVFGIHFAEVGYLSVKVTEAANFATFDATGRQIHQYTNRLETNMRGGAVSGAQGEANGRYSDWRGNKAGGAAPEHVFTTASGLSVTCQEIGRPGSPFPPPLNVGRGLVNVYDDSDQGGMRCWAEGQVDITGIGSFHDQGGGFFKVDHIAKGRTTIKVCSFGRAWGGGGNGDCAGKVPILLGDWSLSGAGEYDECDLYNGGNAPYKDTVETAFNTVKGPTGTGTSLAAAVAGYATDEGAYWFTFKGEESQFIQDMRFGVHTGPDEFTVTPGGPYEKVPEYQAAFGARQACFLGFPCSYTFSSKP